MQTLEVDKDTMMRRCELSARDFHVLDPLFVYPSMILGRERAIVVNLEQIRCVVTADEVLLLDSIDSYVFQYATELQRRLLQRAKDDELPFEFLVLELALEAACSFLDAQAAELQIEAYPLRDELTSKMSTLNLERVRRLKSRLVALTRRVQKVRDEIEQLMDDEGDMAEMYLTEKKMRMESSAFGDQLLLAFNSAGAGTSVSAPMSPASSPTALEELVMLLEAYFVVIDSTLNKLTSLMEYIDDTEDFINIQLRVSSSSHRSEMDDEQARELEALDDLLSDPSAEPIKLSFGLLKLITDKFSNEIGHGGFGVVYKGDLRNGVVAVKMLNAHNVADKQFMDEIKCLKSANHKNIVRFLGYCADTQEEMMPLDGTFVMAGKQNRLLCFEYVPNGNIRQYLQQEKPHGDEWPTRYHMIRGICEGLRYLHEKQISHLDLKPENVMLDAHMEAKIADFGLSRFLDQGKSKMITQHILGTPRYIAPEVIDKGEISFKSDIYALGIIIIELLTGISMICLENWHESLDMDNPQVRSCIEAIARKCIEPDKDKRPTVGEIIHELDEIESTNDIGSSTHKAEEGICGFGSGA